MSTGWIKLSRDMSAHWLWTGEFSRGQAWIDLLIHASHSDNQKMIIKGEVISWSRGQQIRSVKTLQNTWGWSRSKVNRFLELLEKDGMIIRQGGHLTTIISICNYDSFQGLPTSVDTSVDTSNGHLTDISRATNKNVNKEKNVISKDIIDFSVLNMSDSEVEELKKIRKKNKGATLTQRAVNGLAKEFNQARNLGYTVEELFTEWDTRGWKSFKSDWIKPKLFGEGNGQNQQGNRKLSTVEESLRVGAQYKHRLEMEREARRRDDQSLGYANS